MTRKEIEKEILTELKLLNKNQKFTIHECFKGYPANFTTKEVDGVAITTKTTKAYARTEYCIDFHLNKKEISLVIVDQKDLQYFKNFIGNSASFLKNYLGSYNEEYIDLLVYKINTERLFSSARVNEIIIETFFKGQKLSIELSQHINDNLLTDFIKIYNGPQQLDNRCLILRIRGFSFESSSIQESDLKTLLNSIFFDIKCLRNEYFEVYNYNQLARRFRLKTPLNSGNSKDKHKLVVKNLIPELIDYLKVADRIDYLPFKFLCYYHILEYFLDKSAHLTIKRKLDAVLYQPDFDLNSDFYIGEILQTFKEEGDRLNSDKIKIQRVLQEFLERGKFLSFIDDLEFKDHFFSNQVLEFQTNVDLNSLKRDTDVQLFKSLTERIYSIRCSIVHSNPDFGVKKGVPFVSSDRNLSILEKEVFLLEEIAKTLILKSKSNNS